MFWKNNDAKFISILREHSARTAEAAQELVRLFENVGDGESAIQRIAELEHQCDDLARDYYQLLDRTFITKIDKADLIALIHEADHVIDFMCAASLRVRIYHLTVGRAESKQFANIILRMTEALPMLIDDVHRPKNSATQKHVVTLKELEEEADQTLHRALEDLFLKEKDLRIAMQWKDIFEKLEEVADHCEDVANVVSSIARKEA